MVEQGEKVLAMRAAPNTSLQRTPAAAPPSPLISQALGGWSALFTKEERYG
jgi:hypothetical protein